MNSTLSSKLDADASIPSTIKRIQTEEDGDQQDALKSIRVMLEREQSSYSIPHLTEGDDDDESPKPFSVFVKPSHRKRIVEWCFAMVETMELRRETTERTINCIDRFVLLQGGRILLSDPILYQRAVITALYSMVKCHEEEAIPIEDMAFVCSGGDEDNDVSDEDLDHTSEQLAAMEVVLLNELEWNVNPPTSYEYLAHFLKLLKLPFTNEFDPVYEVEEETPSSDEQENSETKWLLELAIFEVQQNLKDYDSAKLGAFHSAYNAFMNALPMLDGGAEMARRLEALLSATVVPDLERYRTSDTTSNASTTSRLSSLEGEEDEEADDMESQTSSDDSSIESSDDSSISSAEEDDSVADELREEIVETTIEIRYPPVGSESHREMFRSHHDATGDMFRSNHEAIGDITKLGLEDNESPSCVMDRALSTVMQTSLVAQTATLLGGED